MHVYFVRHGETSLNRQHIHQSPNTPLSDNGRDQAMSTAEILRVVNPDLLISSEYTRALETARIIGLRTGLTPVTNGLFYEVERPSKLFNRSTLSPETLWYELCSAFNRKNPQWRYADAENFTDISNRAQKALRYIESLYGQHESIVIVSHTVFINVMVSYMCKNRMLDFRDLFRIFFDMERMKNGSVIHVQYAGPSSGNTCSWSVVNEV
jgi:broad specificity phosphatase PhoE